MDCLHVDTQQDLHQAYHLVWIWAGILIMSGVCLWLAPIFFPFDEMVLSRSLLLRIPGDLLNAGLLMTAVVFFDILTPGSSLKVASCEPFPASILLGSFLLSLAIIIMSN
jgi:hypothetical protein